MLLMPQSGALNLRMLQTKAPATGRLRACISAAAHGPTLGGQIKTYSVGPVLVTPPVLDTTPSGSRPSPSKITIKWQHKVLVLKCLYTTSCTRTSSCYHCTLEKVAFCDTWRVQWRCQRMPHQVSYPSLHLQ